jgi:uncharacterized protein
MALVQQIDNDLKASQLARQAERVSTLRLLKTNLKNTAIAKRVSELVLTDDDVISAVRQEVKKRKEAIEAFEKGGREDLAANERNELAILEPYLPVALSDAELQVAIETVIKENGLEPPLQFGRLMGLVVKQVAGRAEGGAVKAAVEAYIASH